MRKAAPDAKILVLLRDPVERYRSGLALQTQTRRSSQAAASAAFRLGCYATHLEQLYASFPREQVLVQLHERCVADPDAELARTYASSGSTTSFVPDDLATPRNQSKSVEGDAPRARARGRSSIAYRARGRPPAVTGPRLRPFALAATSRA